MTIFNEMIDLKRHLLRRDVDLTRLPPFALSPEQVFALGGDDRVFRENAGNCGPPEVFTVHGLRFVQSDLL